MIRCTGCMEMHEDNIHECPHCGYSKNNTIESYYLKPGIELFNGRYTIGNVLGRGGFGITYIAWDHIADKKVSIKEYFPSEFSSRNENSSTLSVFSGSEQENFRKGLISFTDEANRLAKLSSIDGIIKIFDCFEENNTAYIVMEYLEGESLAEKLKRENKMSVDETLNMMMPIMKSLVSVHNEGIIHRDISPDNIYVLKDGTAKLLDFGASRQSFLEETRSLTVIVKAGYSPEEQYTSNGKQGTWTDVYALASTMYRMITGKKPDDAIARTTSLHTAKKDSMMSITECGIDANKNVLQAIERAMNVYINERTQDVQTFIDELQQDKSTVKKFRFNKKKIILGITAMILLLVVVTVITYFTDVMPGKIFRNNDKVVVDTQVKDEVNMPSLVGMSLEEAEHHIKKLGLNYEIVEYVEDNEKEVDTVLSQDIEENKVVDKNTVIKLTVSCKAKSIAVVNVVGLDEASAKELLEKMGLTVNVEYEVNEDVEQGSVISQSLAEGEFAPENGVIIIKVCKNEESSEEITDKPTSTKKTSTQNTNSDKINSTEKETPTGNSSTETSTSSNTGSNDNTPVVTYEPVTDFKYTITNNSATINSYVGSSTNVVIPSSIEGMPVTTIAAETFMNDTDIKTVDIPTSIKTIGQKAFYGCLSLTKISIPSSVTNLGASCFENCSSLESATINISGNLGASSFKNCANLKTCVIGNNVKVLESYAFHGCTNMTTLNLGAGVTDINYYCFYKCKSIQEVIIPNSVKVIQPWAFFECVGIKKLSLGTSLTAIGAESFMYCTGIPEINIPDSVTSIGYNAFDACTSVKTIKVGNGVKTLEQGVFAYCSELTSVTLGKNVTTISKWAFTNDKKITTITMYNSVKTIADRAFELCNGLTTVNFYGTQADWNAISIDSTNNEAIISATKFYK